MAQRGSLARMQRGLSFALSVAVAIGVAVDAQEARLDRLVQSRSLEQPQPSARRVALPSDNPLEVLPVFGNVYLVARGPSNVAVQVGEEGVLLVDAATAAVSDRVLEAVRALSDGPLSYIINTTSDREHYGGNAH